MIYSPERLIQEWELPEVYRMEHAKAVVEPDEQPEGSTRRRTAVTYDDGMSEEQWLQVRSSLSLSAQLFLKAIADSVKRNVDYGGRRR